MRTTPFKLSAGPGLAFIFLFAEIFLSAGNSFATPPKMVLTQSVMCEQISNFQPKNPAVLFSMSQAEVYCFTGFDPVNENTWIYHDWYKKDKLIFSMRLKLSVPKWSCFSKIQMREADKGPWRVEIRDEDNNIVKTLRFSISD